MAASSCCVSGAALGAAIASLFASNQARRQEHERLAQHWAMTAQAASQWPSAAPAAQKWPSAAPAAPQWSQIADQSAGFHRSVSNTTEIFQRKMSMSTENVLAVGWEGFSMEDARTHAQEGAKKAKDASPAQVLSDLQRGNFRFWTGKASRPDKTAFERRALMTKQYPRTAILGCADSRVPTEIVFDQGLGDIFVVRVAGNFLDTATAGSLQYAVNHLKVKVLIVLGHEGCGAIKAACLPEAKIRQEPEELSSALLSLREGLDQNRLQQISDSRARDRESVVSNVHQQLDKLTVNPTIRKAIQAQELIIVGAFYEISSGIVDFFHEVCDENLASAPLPPGVPAPPRAESESPTPATQKVVMNGGVQH